MAMVLVPGIGVERNGALRWINLAGLQFQPSEVMKIALVLILAMMISKDPGKIKKFWTRISSIIMLCITCFWVTSYSRPFKRDDDNCCNYCSYSIHSRC